VYLHLHVDIRLLLQTSEVLVHLGVLRSCHLLAHQLVSLQQKSKKVQTSTLRHLGEVISLFLSCSSNYID
jgi:hypothetical protein